MQVWKAGYEAHASAAEREIRTSLEDIKRSMAALLKEVTDNRIRDAGQTAKVNVWLAAAGAIAAAALSWMLANVK